ncbi:NrsF family protein [Lichenicoccus sp.]|uniref:NrsF family protein n=1 Tax=Lichenicoccus sp. TaxID=2781899 RepID=UPI003D107737
MVDDQLLERLVDDLRPRRRRRPGIEALAILSICALELALLLGTGFVRPDMIQAMALASFWWKLGSLGLLAIGGGVTSILSFDPSRSPRLGLSRLLALLILCLVGGWFVGAPRAALTTLLARLDWSEGIVCLAKMVVLSLPPLFGLGLLMRRGAPTQPVGTALAVGITAAACGALIFVFACPHDDPLYIAVWYVAGCGLVTLAARLLLPILTRW